VSVHCDARARGDATELPMRAPKRAPKRVHAVAALVLRDGKALAVQRPAKGLLGGLWELPGAEVATPETTPRRVAVLIGGRVGLPLASLRKVGAIEWAFTHRALRLTLHRAEAGDGRVRLEGWTRHRWVAPDRFAALPIGTVTRRALAVVLERDG
jgi:A/G-specific adenine glycosylase